MWVLSLTFNRDDFTPKQLMENTALEDEITILTFKLPRLSEALEAKAILRDCKKDGQYYEANFKFLKDMYFDILFEVEYQEWPPLKSTLKNCAKNLEWVLFYLENRIAFSQLIQKLDEDGFEFSEKEKWLDMCRAWGNKPTDFKFIFWEMKD